MDVAQMSAEPFSHYVATCSVAGIEGLLHDWDASGESALLTRFASALAEELAVRPRDAATAACLLKLAPGLAGLGRHRGGDRRLQRGPGDLHTALPRVRGRELYRVSRQLAAQPRPPCGSDRRLRRGARTIERLGEEINVARCLGNRAHCLRKLDRYEEAIAGYDEARAVFASDDQDANVATCMGLGPTLSMTSAAAMRPSLATTKRAPSMPG